MENRNRNACVRKSMTWHFADGKPNLHSIRVLTAEQVRVKLDELLGDDRGQEVQIVVWEKKGMNSYWLKRDEAIKLFH
jgi:hypothetical protein